MKVTLKKAAALAALLAGSSVRIDHTYAVDPYADLPGDQFVVDARNTMAEQIRAAANLVECQFIIRQLIGQANQGQINILLTTRAFLEKQAALLNTIPLRKNGTNLAALHRKIEAEKGDESARRFGGGKHILELETESVLEPAIKAVRRKRREIDEELATLNFTTTIELPENVVKLLTELDLV